MRVRSENEQEPDEIVALRVRLAAAEEKIVHLTNASLDTLAAYNELVEKVNELSLANEIILNIQQSLLEELGSAQAPSRARRQIMMPFFSHGNNDDDDLPN